MIADFAYTAFALSVAVVFFLFGCTFENEEDR